MAVPEIFGANVRVQRKKLGITQEELAHKAGLARSFMSDVERGAKNATVITIARIALALGVEAALLMEGIPERTDGQSQS